MVVFSGSGRGSAELQNMEYAIHVNGTIENHTYRRLDWASGADADDMYGTLHSQAMRTLSDGDTVDVRYKTNTGTFYVNARSLIVIKLSD